MAYPIKKSTTAQPLVFLMVDSADHVSPKTGLSPTVTLSKAGGSFASPAGAVTEIGSGWYKVAGNATDSGTLGPLLLHATATGADPTDVMYWVSELDPQDAVRAGLTALPNATPGQPNGVLIAGTNASATFTDAVNLQAGLVISQSSSNEPAIKATGNGTGAGILATSGSGATGNGIAAISAATNGQGLAATGAGTGAGVLATSGSGATGDGISAVAASTNGRGIAATGSGNGAGTRTVGGATGAGLLAVGGGTSGAAISATTTSGDAMSLAPTAGHAINAAANGTDKHGFVATGGTSGTSDGVKAVAGTGGVPIRGSITGNISGEIDTATTIGATGIAAIWSYLLASAQALAATTIGRFVADRLALITTSTRVLVTRPIAAGTNFEIFKNETRTVAAGSALVWTVPAGPELATAMDTGTWACTLKLTKLVTTNGDSAPSFAGVITSAGAGLAKTLTFELTATNTSTLAVNTEPIFGERSLNTGRAYRYRVEVSKTGFAEIVGYGEISVRN